ncbi:RNA cytidine acetyltransferase l(1)G0020 isoform X1 [Brevipalpus obovatus]|uniref:RNA cytidine acetyltransferase l(1)G0020 isoform X1 n=1 Tax=Brevipalpus obovatus TaxID=246614 RepID=UPI003D9DEB1D
MNNRKKIDNRIRVMIENNIIHGFRTIFAIIGPKARDQVVIINHMLMKSQIKPKPCVLWCYKKELGFSTNRRKRVRTIKRKERAGNATFDEDDPFEMFITGTNIRWSYYHETDKILGNTYDMLILQDFEALTPNLLARTIETIEGGGIIVFLLNTLDSLQQLYTMTMEVHGRYRTEAHKDVVARFNERFILSLSSCPNFIGIDDKLNILPLSSHITSVEPVPKPGISDPPSQNQQELNLMKKSLLDYKRQPLAALVDCCRTLDQAKAVETFVDSLSQRVLRTTVSMTAARGRGKSAALGLAIAGAIGFNYCNIYVTSPSPQNLKTLFDFILKGLDAMNFKQHLDYEVVQSSNPDFNKAVIRVEVTQKFRQVIQYIPPAEVQNNSLLKSSAELVVIDEAAAIPLPIVRSMLGPYLVFMSSTINGYEGTGRSLSLKLLKQLRENEVSEDDPEARTLHEIKLEESIRYKTGDPVEAWLNQLLCLEVNNEKLRAKSNPPEPDECELFYINRDTLFSFHPASEAFLQKLMALYVASHYKNSPNDLQMMSDAPAHHLFCLLGPSSNTSKNRSKLPEIFCFIQVGLEGEISKDHVNDNLSKGKRASGDLIPWTLSQQFQDSKFPSLSGVRVIRVATNPNYQGKGYGSKALHLLEAYYRGEFIPETGHDNFPPDEIMKEGEDDEDDEEGKVVVRKNLPPLLSSLTEREPERLDYIGVCYGLTGELLRFWKRNEYIPVYLRQTPNELTGEFSCIMVKVLARYHGTNLVTVSSEWLKDFWNDFRRRFVCLLSQVFRSFPLSLCLDIIQCDLFKEGPVSNPLSKSELKYIIEDYGLDRLKQFDESNVKKIPTSAFWDFLPIIALFYFTHRLDAKFKLENHEESLLLGVGLQGKSIETVAEETNYPHKKLVSKLRHILLNASKSMLE